MMLRKKKIYCKDIRNELKSFHNKTNLSKFCIDAGFTGCCWNRTVLHDERQLKNSHNSQMKWPVVSTPCQETKIHLNQKVGSDGIPKWDPCLKSQPAICKVSMEWKLELELVNKDSSHSWVRISHGLKKLVTDLSNTEDDDNEQETSEMQFEDCALKTNVLAFTSRTKAKAKLQRCTSACSSTRTVPIGERTSTDIEPQEYSLSEKKCRRNWFIFVMEVYFETTMERLNSGE